MRPGRRVKNPEATREHLAFIEQALLQRVGRRALCALARQQFGLGWKRVDALTKRVRDRWIEEDKDQRASLKAQAARAIERDMQAARNDLASKPQQLHNALARYHSLLADIQGTRAPIEMNIDVHVSASVQAVIANLSSEEVQEHLTKYRENQRLADEYRKRLGTSPIDSAAE